MKTVGLSSGVIATHKPDDHRAQGNSQNGALSARQGAFAIDA